MRRRLAHLLTATSLALFGGIAIAAPASAGPAGPNPRSNHGQCTSLAAGQHTGWFTGLHRGWEKQGGATERRNVGGACGPL